MDNQTISALPTTDSEVFADCESFLTDLSANDESMIAGGLRLSTTGIYYTQFYRERRYSKRHRYFRKYNKYSCYPRRNHKTGRVAIS